ncbi:DNA-binding protein [uncultured archaeon]|nr:DNA-binding protein [uncultured archaeon]
MAPEDEGGEEGQDPRQKLYQQRMQQMQMEMKKKELLRRMLSDPAYERMMNVRLSSPELYEKVVQSLAYVAQSGKRMGKISDGQLYSLLAKMSEKKETSIEFRRK